MCSIRHRLHTALENSPRPPLGSAHARAGGVAGATPNLTPYKALRPIGKGAVGEVFLARHMGDGQLYAVKTVPLDAPTWKLELLKREVRGVGIQSQLVTHRRPLIVGRA